MNMMWNTVRIQIWSAYFAEMWFTGASLVVHIKRYKRKGDRVKW